MKNTDKIKKFFQWILTMIGLILVIIGSVQFLNLALKQWIFPKADYNYCYQPVPMMNPKEDIKVQRDNYDQCKEQQTAQKQRDAAQALAFLITGTPIFLGFYRTTKSEKN